jgi:hypothetical protein
MSGSRCASFVVAPEIFIGLCQPGPPRWVRIVKHPLPADAVYIRHGADAQGNLVLVVWSASFAEVPLGQAMPMLPPTVFELVHAEFTETRP